MKTKDKPMRMQWVTLLLTIGIAITNSSNSVWQWIACTLMALVTGGLFVASWYQTNNQLEEWELENEKFESECEAMVKDLEAKNYTRVEKRVMAFLNDTSLLILFGSGIVQTSCRYDTFLVETKDRLRLVSAENYVIVLRSGEKASSLVFEK